MKTKLIKNFSQVVSVVSIVTMLLSCAQPKGNIGGAAKLSNVAASPANVLTAEYSATSSDLTSSYSLTQIVGTVVCATGDNTGGGTSTTIVFSGQNISSFTPAIKISPNQTDCTFRITSVTANSVSYNTCNAASGGANSHLLVSSNANSVPSNYTSNATKCTNGTDSMYLNGLIWTYYNPTAPEAPKIYFKYSTSDSVVTSTAQTGFTTVSLTGTSNSGVNISAPTYCVGNQTSYTANTAGNACSQVSTDGSFQLGYDASSYILTSTLSLYWPNTNNVTTGQLGESYLFTRNNGSNLGTNCGGTAAAPVTSGCTYGVIDTFFTNAKTTTTYNVYPFGGAPGTLPYISTPYPSSTIIGNGTVSSPPVLSQPSGPVLTGQHFLTFTHDVMAVTGVDFLGFTRNIPTLNSLVPALAAANSLVYLIIQHVDAGSGVPSYQLIMLGAAK